MTSVIICSANEAKFKSAVEMYTRILPPMVFEIIGVHDPVSLTVGYNTGVKAAKGDRLIFSHDDLKFIGPGVGQKIASYLDRFDLIGLAGTQRLIDARWLSAGVPHIFGQVAHRSPAGKPGYTVDVYGAPRRCIADIVALDGLFMACNRAVAEKVPLDQATFDGFHGYDVDFSFSAHRAGFKLAVCCDLGAVHASPGSFNAQWQIYADRFKQKHAGHLHSGPAALFQWCSVYAANEADIMDIMQPGYWDD